ncbi:MAG: type II toxin-antitoxin system HicB family antitoxin [Candidatus Scalindua sp. AMX11]|nr:MAG: type II toxin-antitoxin system HicB family antitoxin [Candidatus Scalindua sp.]NOG82921.1 type II toxin-antitoxin system HicB family antitoxin [Planctomycetota bacterium]RZV86259.1 MAG: type II toxin-antitoxin system HicB family antitoxin [Candidatus Scalindua sp. SCAELEC01]TDE65882.1 MAG: type II toxin-antitoxin system HicB family antitoxin [Candidatus Scalindua sp. AMX11]GJQ60275.1 MAG: antitoxin HicB [Candidatus Scalindua sp.]
MLVEYVHGALENAEYKKLEDGTWFVEIPGFEGVWANGKTVEESRKELVDVLEEWLILKLRDKDPIPSVKGYEINITKVKSA